MRDVHGRRLAAAVLLIGMLATGALAAYPTDRGLGTADSGTGGAVDPGIPSGTTTGDLMVMYCETYENYASCASNCDSGWSTLATATGGSSTAESKLTILYSIADATPIAPTMTDSGDHTACVIQSFSGQATNPNTGNPWDVSGTASRSTTDATVSMAMGTTTGTECIVVFAFTTGVDGTGSTNMCSNWTDASLASVAEVHDLRHAAGNGGIKCVGKGTLASAGSGGTFSADVIAEAQGPGGSAYFAVCGSIPAAARRIFNVN